jgi:hypothetical protein
MSKLAVFVEGQAERLWIERLLLEIAGRHRIRVESQKAFGGRKFERTFYEFSESDPDRGQRFFVLLTDCGTDGRVASEIRDQFQSLLASD